MLGVKVPGNVFVSLLELLKAFVNRKNNTISKLLNGLTSDGSVLLETNHFPSTIGYSLNESWKVVDLKRKQKGRPTVIVPSQSMLSSLVECRYAVILVLDFRCFQNLYRLVNKTDLHARGTYSQHQYYHRGCGDGRQMT